MILNKTIRFSLLLILVSITHSVWAQSALEALRFIPEEPKTEKTSYYYQHQLFYSGSGPKDKDPNVYVYTKAFADRFQMPQEWVSADLKGADAVAFRIVPSYATCGWGGDPKACRTDEVTCEMDVYFDHKNNPLPWDERFPKSEISYRNSLWFLYSRANPTRRLKRQNEDNFVNSSPFVHPQTGKGLGWQYFGNGWGWQSASGYDKEIFKRMAMITFNAGCYGSPYNVLALASSGLDHPFDPHLPEVAKFILFPESWRDRVKEAMRESNERQEAFFKREGEKAIKALREGK